MVVSERDVPAWTGRSNGRMGQAVGSTASQGSLACRNTALGLLSSPRAGRSNNTTAVIVIAMLLVADLYCTAASSVAMPNDAAVNGAATGFFSRQPRRDR